MAARTLLGFDYGLKRIGVAVGQELTGTASALTTVAARDGKPDWEAISRLIDEWQPDAVVVGLPLNMDGSDHELSRRARRFGNQLHGRYNLPAHFIDERLSSLEAEALLRGGSQAHRKALYKESIDKLAAQVILETWLSAPPPQDTP
ncbi:MAG TPA: Holliday junction resolvase RuvX [Gammaproteobacteria bacterium]|nr:Holliday junction resolvase RuvX [Gammaproteobacteria bacterium]